MTLTPEHRNVFRNLLKKPMPLPPRLRIKKEDLLVKSNGLRSKSRKKRREIESEDNNIYGFQKTNVTMDCFVFKRSVKTV